MEIGILTIKEIIGMMRITPVPQTPDYVKGVIKSQRESHPGDRPPSQVWNEL